MTLQFDGTLTVWRNICVTNDNRYVLFVVITIRSFPHSWLNIGCVTSETRRLPNVVQELLTLPEHMSSLLGFSGVRVVRSLVFCVMFCRLLFVRKVLFLLAFVLSVLRRLPFWIQESSSQTLVVIGTDCIGREQSNYNTFVTWHLRIKCKND